MATAAIAAPSVTAAPGPVTSSWVTPAGWQHKAMRWLTMNMVQNDPGNFDPDFWIDYVKRCHVDAASWNSGGYVALYPTRIPFHQRAETLGDSDPLGYLIEGCRKLGIVVTARVEHHATYPAAAAAHPEWISTDRSGELRHHWSTPEMYLTCTLGPYNEDFMTSVMREIVTIYRVDGFNHNRWNPQLMCYCDYCRTAFRQASGMELPRVEDNSDSSWAQYVIWREDRIFELWDHWNAEIQKVNPNAFVLPGLGAIRTRANMSKVRNRAQTLYIDHQGRSGITLPWTPGMEAKELRSVMGTKPIGITFSMGHTARYRWKDSRQADSELRIWVSDGVAHGLRPKVAKFGGIVYDKRWLQVVEDMYTWQWKHERYLRNIGYPVANVAFLHSQQTARFYTAAKDRGYDNEDHAKGFYHALIEGRILSDMVHEDLLAVSDLDRFKLLILPNSACLSDKQCEQIRQFVRNGGSLIATFESSLYDEWGKRRERFGLGDLFGVRPSGPVQGPMLNSYLRPLYASPEPHQILDGIRDTDRVINGVYRLPLEVAAEFLEQPIMLIAPYPDLPMEEVYPRDLDKNVPELYLREVGRGRIVYFPFDIDRTFWEVMDIDHGRLLRNAVLWATRNDQPVEVAGKGILDVTVWRQKESMTVHLVNLTNPMMFKAPFQELYSVGEQRVRVRLPEGKKPKRVHLLTADTTPRTELSNGWLTATVPSVEMHEVVAIDL